MATTKKPNIQEGETVREMTDAEYAQWQIDKAKAETQAEAQAADAAAKAAARASALAKLAGLGLTNDEIAALVG
jgi:hypothetical protein